VAPRETEGIVLDMAEDEAAVEPVRGLELLGIDLKLGGQRAGGEAQHDRGRKRPGLRGVIRDLVDHYPGLFADFAGNRLLKAFARLDETRERRMLALGPDRLAAQQGVIAIGHQHDDGGIRAREVRGVAVWRDAAAHMATVLAARRAAAEAAETVSTVPVQDAAGIGKQRAIWPREEGPYTAQVRERDRPRRSDRFQRRLTMR